MKTQNLIKFSITCIIILLFLTLASAENYYKVDAYYNQGNIYLKSINISSIYSPSLYFPYIVSDSIVFNYSRNGSENFKHFYNIKTMNGDIVINQNSLNLSTMTLYDSVDEKGEIDGGGFAEMIKFLFDLYVPYNSTATKISVCYANNSCQTCNVTGQCNIIVPPGKKLLAHYPFEGNANDASGNGNNGMNYGGVNGALFINGKIGQGASFNGISSNINIGNPASLNFGKSSFSLGAWFKTSSLSHQRIISKGHSGWTNGYLMLLYQGKVFAGVGAGNVQAGSAYISTNKTFNDNNWHYAVAVFDFNNNIQKIYVDSVAQNLTKWNGTCSSVSGSVANIASCNSLSASTSNNLEIGSDSVPANGFFNGSIDEVKIWNYALNSTEIINEYQRGNLVVKKLVAYYPFEGNANDASGNGNNGIINRTNLTSGKIGQAYSFNGINSYIEIPNSPALQDITEGSYTWSAWYYPNSRPPNTATHNVHSIICKQGFHTSLFYDNNTNLGLFTWDITKTIPATASIFGSSSLNTSPNKWFHIAGVVDSSTKKVSIYVNGAYKNSITYSSLLDYGNIPIRIGICNNPGQNNDWPANGIIDEVKIWNYALNASEINQEYRRVPGCTSSSNCNDNNSCTNDNCSGGNCIFTPVPNGTSCVLTSGLSSLSPWESLLEMFGITGNAIKAKTVNVCKSGQCISCTPQCTGKKCGDNGCWGSCGTCAVGKICILSTGTCCKPKKCKSNACGIIDDGCGGTVNCTCPVGKTCSNGKCCLPKTCSKLGKQCGNWSDGCGKTINCGTCPVGKTCKSDGKKCI